MPVTYVGSEDRRRVDGVEAQFDKHARDLRWFYEHDKHASEAMKLLLEDVTAHRYFEGVHLEPALKELGLAGLGPDPPTLIEAELSGGGADDTDEVTLSLIFYSPECPYKLWAALDRKGTSTRSSGATRKSKKSRSPRRSSPCACPCSSRRRRRRRPCPSGRLRHRPWRRRRRSRAPSRDR